MKMVLASNNAKKLRELRAILGQQGYDIVSLSEAGVLSDPEETGTTFEQNAIIKARAACQKSGFAAIADDSGLEVDALSGAPGIYSARYCDGNDDDRIDFLLANMKAVSDGMRTARLVSAIACVFPDGREVVVRGVCEGTILHQRQGSGGFGYDPVFWVENEKQTFASLSEERKNQISHRAMALFALAERLKD